MDYEAAVDATSPQVAHNVSMDDESTPKKRGAIGPIFDVNEFGPADTGPLVQESALVSQIKE